ncbi:patatin-like phospholipase family protein [bacterium]|nr:patatin-like phospholipase family protein [FCB group bacterium]MBL7192063.1 patatin-like phospholipase family protein [bacterium]
MKIGLALGGGGARGIAHIGVIHELVEKNIKFDLIAGTSMGSIIGAMYAQMGDPFAVERKLLEYVDSEEFQEMDLHSYHRDAKTKSFFGSVAKRIEEQIVINLSISNPAIFKKEKFIAALDFLLEDGKIENLPVKYAAVAGDLLSGRKHVFTHGDIKTAALASSSIPGFIPPVEFDDMLLTDGEISDLIPVETARELGADFIIAVDVRQELSPPPPLENAMDIFFRAGHIRSNLLSERMLKSADVVIKPDVSSIHWTRFDKVGTLVDLGKEAGRKAAASVKRMIRIKKFNPKYW